MTCAALLTSAHAAPAGDARLAPVALADSGLSISAPSGPVDLGAGAPGSTFDAQLGEVTVTAAAGVLSWTATVTLSDAFSATQEDQTWDLPKSRVSYLSGPRTSVLGLLDSCGTLQSGAQTLDQSRPVFGCSEPLVGDVSGSISWNPTLTIETEATDPTGTYTGTITHSVA